MYAYWLAEHMCAWQHTRRRSSKQERMRQETTMYKVAFVCQKGGAGKTTAAIHTAIEGTRRGLKTLLIDIDPQASAAKILDRRGDDPPDVSTEAAGRLERAM